MIHVLPILLCAGALICALVLLRMTLTGGMLPGCGPGSACGEVSKGRWGRLGPIPVSLIGAMNYVLLLLGAVLVHPAIGRVSAWRSTVALATLVLIAAVWFMVVQLVIVRKICPWCTAAHLCAAGAAGMLLYLAPVNPRGPILIAAGLGILFIAGQIIIRPKLYAVTEKPADPHPNPLPEYREREREQHAATPAASPSSIIHAPSSSPPATRRITVMRNQISLSQHLWPVLGPRSAEHVLIDLLDFTCHDCRHMHELLLEAIRHFDGRLCVIPMPVPMDPSCNPAVRGMNPRHRNACPIARQALAVWRANPEMFEQFDLWLFRNEEPRPLEEVQAEAARLVGVGPLKEALADPWLDKRINEGISIYQAVGAGRIPNLLTPHAMIQGVVPDAPELIKVLENQFRIPAPANA